MQNLRNLQGIYCTFESSLLSGVDNPCGSPSTGSISGNGSTVSLFDPESPSIDSLEIGNLWHHLKELESVMMEPTSDNFYNENWQQLREMISRRELREVLIACAKAISNDDLLTAGWLISELQHMVSVSGEPIQRLGAYILEGLIARYSSSGISIYRALNCKEPTSSEFLSYMQVLYEVCPYFKFGYMSANGAIAEALKNEDRIHIIDFQIAQGSQWVSLIQALAARPGGPPRVRITGIDDSTSEFARGGGLNIVGERLSMLAKACNLPFEFHAAALSCGAEVKVQNLVLKSEEALAVNFPFLLHHIPDESVGPQNHRDTLLRLVKSWSPKVVTLVEYELNTNSAPFYPRFLETLEYYSAIFESINVTLSKDRKERINVEQHCLAKEIVNIIACEGAERVERHELHGKWRSRFTMAGFKPYPLNPLVNATIKNLLQKYSRCYGLEERDGTLYLGWMNRAMVTSCAWQ
ncbi:scarecrow-like protein 21 [Chenopodium quinoa]|uniref:scarecrow-like protein 21 n=1 Tax=Chenopodium quinoa TaxID=63459 RepID=UPI000B77452F|nr:scarecrow-like protein 21 [Chenopodium quinoa]